MKCSVPATDYIRIKASHSYSPASLHHHKNSISLLQPKRSPPSPTLESSSHHHYNKIIIIIIFFIEIPTTNTYTSHPIAPTAMPFITPFAYPQEFLRLLEEATAHPYHRATAATAAFSPRFDVAETAEAYVLEGELPGLTDKAALQIEFSERDASTIIIKGTTKRPSPASALAPTNSTSTPTPAPTTGENKSEGDQAAAETPAAETSPATAATAAAETETEVPKTPVTATPTKARYWIAERKAGKFERAFRFEKAISQDAVTASLKYGVLTVVVPKREPVLRRIVVQ